MKTARLFEREAFARFFINCLRVFLRNDDQAVGVAEHDFAIVQHNHHVRTGEWRMRLSAGLRKKYHAAIRERAVAESERDDARHELAELCANLDAAEARLRGGRP